MSSSLDGPRFEFENTPVRLVATRNIPRIETAGMVVGEAEAGKELVVDLWVAWELTEGGLARLADDGLSGDEWTQIHYRERFQPLGQVSPLPNNFYARAYITLSRLAREAGSDETRVSNLNRLRGMFRDVLESRIGKIMRLASSDSAPQLRDLQPEEAELCSELNMRISSWRKELRRLVER